MSGSFVLRLGAVLALVLVTGWIFKTRFLDREAELRAELVGLEKSISATEKYNHRRLSLAEEMKGYETRTLGATSEEVEHKLRVLLHEIGVAQGLQGLVVDSRSRRAALNPAAQENSRLFRDKDERKRPDFIEVEGSLSGSGSLEQVTAALAQLQSQPWLKRVESVRMSPREGGSVIDLNVAVVILYLPGVAPTEPILAATHATEGASRAAETIAARALFAPVQPEAPKPATPPRADKPKPPPPPPVPYGDWRITGFGRGAAGPILYVASRQGESKVLAPGDTVLNIVFRGLDGPFVVLELEGKLYHFGEGDWLDRRDEVRRTD